MKAIYTILVMVVLLLSLYGNAPVKHTSNLNFEPPGLVEAMDCDVIRMNHDRTVMSSRKVIF